MKIYAGPPNKDHNAEGLLSFDETVLGQFLIQELTFHPEEPGFIIAKEKILDSLRKVGLCAIWTDNGTAFFLSEQVIRQTAGNMLSEDFFSESSRKRFVAAIIAELKKDS